MTFEYRDPDYDLLRVEPAPHHSDGPRIILHAEFAHDLGTDMAEVAVPLDRVEEVVAGIRDAARTASGQQPECVPCGDTGACNGGPCAHPATGGAVDSNGIPKAASNGAATPPDPTTADDPTPLRWGLGDVLHGDDDTVIVCLSGPAPDRAPYWLELDAERAAALRDDLAAPAAGQPAEAHTTDEARPPRTAWRTESIETDGFETTWTVEDER